MKCNPPLSNAKHSGLTPDALARITSPKTSANIDLAPRAGLQPATPCLEGTCSDATELPGQSAIVPAGSELLEVLKDILNYDGLLIHEDRFNRAVAAVRKAEGRL